MITSGRALLCAGLLLALPVFDFELARHSVHHLGSADSGCLLAGASSNVPAVSPDRNLVGRATPDVIGPVRAADVPRLLARPIAHHQGRAPPALAMM